MRWVRQSALHVTAIGLSPGLRCCVAKIKRDPSSAPPFDLVLLLSSTKQSNKQQTPTLFFATKSNRNRKSSCLAAETQAVTAVAHALAPREAALAENVSHTHKHKSRYESKQHVYFPNTNHLFRNDILPFGTSKQRSFTDAMMNNFATLGLGRFTNTFIFYDIWGFWFA